MFTQKSSKSYFSSLCSVVSGHMAKTSGDRYNQIISNCRIIAAICGGDVLNPNYKMSIVTWTVILAINAYFGCTIYTMYMGMVIDGDWKVILQSLSLAGSAMQGYSKLLLCVYRRQIMRTMHLFLSNTYQKYEKKEECFQETLQYRIDLTVKVLKIVLVIYIFTVVGICTFPFIYGAIYGEKMLVMQFLLPGIDHKSDTGFIIHNAFHIFLICLGGFGNFAGDIYVFILIVNVPLVKDIFKLKCEKLNEVSLKTHDQQKTMPLLKDIVEWHQSYNIYIQQIEEVYYGVIFIQIFTSVLSICCTLFSLLIGGWPAAFVYLGYSSILFYVYCGLGNVVEKSNDQIIDIIYSDCLWYELTVPEQKLVLLMIRKSQNPTNLTIGQIMPLSMSTALQLTKAIYSYMMMLLNFLETDEANA